MKTKKLLTLFMFLMIGMFLFIPNTVNATEYVDEVVLDFTSISNKLDLEPPEEYYFIVFMNELVDIIMDDVNETDNYTSKETNKVLFTVNYTDSSSPFELGENLNENDNILFPMTDQWKEDFEIWGSPVIPNYIRYIFYSPEAYDVTFDANGGTFANNQQELIVEDWEDETASSLETPQKEDYIFGGWYTEQYSGGNSLEYVLENGGITKDTTFYARWYIAIDEMKLDFTKYSDLSNLTIRESAEVPIKYLMYDSGPFRSTDEELNKMSIYSKQSGKKIMTVEMNDLSYSLSSDLDVEDNIIYELEEIEILQWVSEGKSFIPSKIIFMFCNPESKDYTYTFMTGDKQTFTIKSIDKYTFKVDGDYSLFKKLTIEKLNLEKDVDYKVEEGSTIITFTDEGLEKLNTLQVGTYDVVVEYTNDKSVTGQLIIEEAKTTDNENDKKDDTSTGTDNTNTGKEDNNTENNTDNTNAGTENDTTTKNNPQTGDNILLFVGLLAISVMGIIITKKIRKNKSNK